MRHARRWRLDEARALAIPVLAVTCLFSCCGGIRHCAAAEPILPGASRDVQVIVDGKSLTLRMVYVPADQGVRADSDGAAAGKGRIVQPFFFAASELSLADFNALAPAAVRESHDANERKMATQEGQKKDWLEMQREADSYVVKMVSLDEAIGITAVATAALAKPTRQNSLRIATERFRLPTAAEWRHAMSMGSQPKNMHINPWPVFDRDFSEKERGRCAEIWTACGGQGAFIGAPEQVLWFIREASGSAEEQLELLTLFLRFLLQGRMLDPQKKNSYSWEVQPEPLAERIDAAPGNEWGIRGAHRGYPEWVLSAATQNEALDLWRRFESGDRSNDDRQRPKFGLCGAASFTLNKNDLKPMLQAFISHETAVLDGKPFFSWQDAEDREVFIDRSVSLRLVLVESLADEWVAVVRSLFADQKDATAVAENARLLLAEVERLTWGPDRSRNESIVNCYWAIAECRCGRGNDAAIRLASNAMLVSRKSSSAEDIAMRIRRAQGGAGSARPTPGSPDGVYLKSVARLMACDDSQARPEP